LQDRTTDTPTKALFPAFGSGDFCLISAVPLDEVIAHLQAEKIAIEAGPVARRGALGALRSIYFRDPDGNLVEVAEYAAAG
jgi:catechol 2,3-dioxygenase-like lactoylglutathione lyase family enzyme